MLHRPTNSIFCAAIKGVDSKPSPTAWGSMGKFGNMLAEFGASPAGGGWVRDVSFSASGDQLAYVAHDACLYVVDGANDSQLTRFKTTHLPFSSVQWVRPDAVIVGGYDYIPFLFKYAGGQITEVGACVWARLSRLKPCL
jgi:actin related protein 2/3 complex subunit 1A/1B